MFFDALYPDILSVHASQRVAQMSEGMIFERYGFYTKWRYYHLPSRLGL